MLTVGKLALPAMCVLILGTGALQAQSLPCEAEALAAIDLTQSTLSGIDLPFVPTLVLNFSLNAAEGSTQAGNAGIAVAWLNFFKNRVQFNEANGNLSSVDADALTQLADEAILLLQNCTSTPRVTFFNVRSDGTENTLFWVNPTTNYDRTIIRARTDTFPTGPNDGMAVADLMGVPDSADSAVHGPLTPGNYFYSAFVDDGSGTFSAAKHSFGEVRDASGPFNWSYTVGGPLPVPGVDARDRYYTLSNDALHAVDALPTGGGWPVGWKPVALPGPPSVQRPVPLPQRNLVFIPTRDGRIVARDLDGNPAWVSPSLGTAVDASVVTDVGTGIAFVGARSDNGDSKFYALNLSDGQIAWEFDNGGGSTGMGPIVGTAAWGNGRVYFSSTQKPFGSGTTETLFSLSYTASSATKEWSASIGDSVSGIGLTATTVFAADTAGELYAFDVTAGLEGTLKWVYDTQDGPVRGFPFVLSDADSIYLSTDNQVQSVDQAGNANWKINVPDPSTLTAFISGGKAFKLYVGGGDNVVRSILASDGTELATFAVAASPGRLRGLAIDVGGVLLVGSDAGVFYGLDLF